MFGTLWPPNVPIGIFSSILKKKCEYCGKIAKPTSKGKCPNCGAPKKQE